MKPRDFSRRRAFPGTFGGSFDRVVRSADAVERVRGIGMEGQDAPRVRFLCLPEIVMWEIVGSRDR
jgi:hypothetical protein